MSLHDGDVDRARAIVATIRARQAAARDAGQNEALMVPAEEVLCAAVELGARDASDAEWLALEERSRCFSVGQERLEVIEIRALSTLRHGRRAEARRHLERALDLAATIPNVLGPRLRAALAAIR